MKLVYWFLVHVINLCLLELRFWHYSYYILHTSTISLANNSQDMKFVCIVQSATLKQWRATRHELSCMVMSLATTQIYLFTFFFPKISNIIGRDIHASHFPCCVISQNMPHTHGVLLLMNCIVAVLSACRSALDNVHVHNSPIIIPLVFPFYLVLTLK